MKPFHTHPTIGILGALGAISQPFFALERHGADYHFGVDGEAPDGLASVKTARLSGSKETEVWGKDSVGENSALLIGGMKLSGEKTGYVNAFEMPDMSGVMTVAGATLIKKGFDIGASNEDFTEATMQGIGAPGVTP